MTSLLDTLIDFHQPVFRNTASIGVKLHPFDDLSDTPSDWQYADKFCAIDSLFAKDNWQPSRFGNGTFPVWYGSLTTNTTFYETGYHWQNGLLADAGWQHYSQPVYTARSVFQTYCASTLVDLRNKSEDFPFITQKNIAHYQETQTLGEKLANEGFPGLVAHSARDPLGSNVAIFKKKILSQPQHEGDFLYAIFPDQHQEIQILDSHSHKKILSIRF